MEEKIAQRPNIFLLLVFGIVLGLAIAFSVWFVIKLRSTKTYLPQTLQKNLSLEVKSPTNSLASSEKTVSVTGSTEVKSIVTITSPSENKIVESSANGTFSIQLNLIEGKNIIKITAFDPSSGESQSQVRTILYLNEDLSNL